MATDAAIIRKIIKRHGAVINLEENPEIIIDIIRQFSPELDDGGLPGGVPPSPPPGPTSFQGGQPGINELMKEVLKIQRELGKIRKQMGA